jgi:hypothetical protein
VYYQGGTSGLLYFRSTKVPKSTKKYQEVARSIKKYLEVPRSTEKYQEVPRSTEKYKEVPRSTEKYERSTLYSFDFYPQTVKKVFCYCAISKTLLPITE